MTPGVLPCLDLSDLASLGHMRSGGLRHVVLAATVAIPLLGTVPSSEAADSDDLWQSFEDAADAHALAAEDLASLELTLEDIDRQIAATEERLAAIEADAQELAVWVYVRAGVDDELSGVLGSDESRLLSPDYAAQAIAADSDVLDSLDAIRADLQAVLATRTDRLDEISDRVADLAVQRDALRLAARRAREAEDSAAAAASAASARDATPNTRGAGPLAATAGPEPVPIGATTPTAATPIAPLAPIAPGIHHFDGPPTDAQLAALRQCESNGNYAVKTNRRYRGAYQFAWRTWDNVAAQQGWDDLVGVDPADAPPATQDAMVRVLYASSGWGPWPVCGRRAAAA